ncbi:MAG TPA: hypothetical protein VK866_03635 [Acidimicrobiales bacterium]|nr:hypothetical protein [Acidimicrobiales bacterium]
MSDAPRLVELVIGDEPAAWAQAGFAVADDGTTRVGGVRIRLVGPEQGRGVRLWGLTGVDDGSIDGLATAGVTAPTPPAPSTEHPNTAIEIDHVVVTSPDLARTIGALAHVGLEPRRSRDVGTPERPMRQVFFRLGDPAPILELVGPREPAGDGPAELWGITVTVADLDLAATRLGEHLGTPKPAVQPGRRIATVRHAPLGASVAIALMTPHPRGS